MKISVIMPCYKMGRFIGEALASVGAQTYENWELLAVDDNGSEDGTRAAVERFAEQHPRHRIEYIRHETNRGVSAARNTAIRAAQGELLAFLDPDDWWGNRYLSLQAARLDGEPNFGMTYTDAWRVNEQGRALADKQGPSEEMADNVLSCLFLGNFIVPSAVVVRKSEILRIGGFDENPGIQHVEDWDMWLRLARAGVGMAYTPEGKCYYRQHASSATGDPIKVYDRLLALRLKHMDDKEFVEANFRRLRELELASSIIAKIPAACLIFLNY